MELPFNLYLYPTIGRPPLLFDGREKNTFNPPFIATTLSIEGTAGEVYGTIFLYVLEAGEEPTSVIAFTATLYVVPFVNPRTVIPTSSPVINISPDATTLKAPLLIYTE